MDGEKNREERSPALERFRSPRYERESVERERIRRELHEEAERHLAEAQRLLDSLKR